MAVIFLRSHKRKPIWIGRRPFREDVQGQIPYGWCEGCGMECFEEGTALCPDCERMEQENGKSDEVSL